MVDCWKLLLVVIKWFLSVLFHLTGKLSYIQLCSGLTPGLIFWDQSFWAWKYFGSWIKLDQRYAKQENYILYLCASKYCFKISLHRFPCKPVNLFPTSILSNFDEVIYVYTLCGVCMCVFVFVCKQKL